MVLMSICIFTDHNLKEVEIEDIVSLLTHSLASDSLGFCRVWKLHKIKL